MFNIIMDDKIDKTLEYYCQKRQEVLDFINSKNKLTPDQIIDSGEQMAIIEYKITALEIAREN